MIFYHEDVEEFLAALTYTKGKTGFSPELIEKDYFCSLILQSLYAELPHDLVFKGGTCLNKVYLGFFRLSEDLDFSISTPDGSNRTERSRLIKPIKKLFDNITAKIPRCKVLQPLSGANNSTQYIGEIHYTSVFSTDPGKIKIDVGLIEPLLETFVVAQASTLVANPFSGKPLIPNTLVQCLSSREVLAEKIRAMFTRKEVAIRDFFDFWHAKHNANVVPDDDALIGMAIKKIVASPYPFIALNRERLAQLEKQLITDLKPVLTEETFRRFSLAEALSEAKSLEERLKC